jgi:hypothetical protein
MGDGSLPDLVIGLARPNVDDLSSRDPKAFARPTRLLAHDKRRKWWPPVLALGSGQIAAAAQTDHIRRLV